MCASFESFCGKHVSNIDQLTDYKPTATARSCEHFIKFNHAFTIFFYNGEYATKLVSVATRVVAPSSVNAGSAFHLGAEAAARLTGSKYADVKLRRNDKVV